MPFIRGSFDFSPHGDACLKQGVHNEGVKIFDYIKNAISDCLLLFILS